MVDHNTFIYVDLKCLDLEERQKVRITMETSSYPNHWKLQSHFVRR